jgi:hypothetical protein
MLVVLVLIYLIGFIVYKKLLVASISDFLVNKKNQVKIVVIECFT